MVPPVPAAAAPVTTRPPLAPVVSSTTPSPALPAAVPAEMLLKFRLLAPMVVLTTLRAVPAVEVSVFGMEPVVTLSVPPVVAAGPGPTALNAVPLAVATTKLLKLNVLPVLVPVMLTPAPAAVPVIVMSCTVAPAVTLLLRIAAPPDGLMLKYSTRLLPARLITFALLLNVGRAAAAILVGATLSGASVIVASAIAVFRSTNWPTSFWLLFIENVAPA